MTTDRRYSPIAVWLIIAVGLLPMFYALSIGPACWLVDHGYLEERVLLIYRPIQIAAEYCRPVALLFGRWLAWWGR